MEDELHVTVIATGLEEQKADVSTQPMIANTREHSSIHTVAQDAVISSKRADFKAAVPMQDNTAGRDYSMPVGSSIRHYGTETAAKQETPVQRQETAHVTSEHVSTKAAFDKMLDEMPNEASSASALPSRIPEPSKKDFAGKASADSLQRITDKSPAVEGPAYNESSVDSQSESDGFIDPLEAILKIFSNREKKRDDSPY